MQKLSWYMFVLAALLSLAAAITATAADELKIVYNVGVAPLKFEDAASRPAGLFPDLWRLWAQETGKQLEFVRVDSFLEKIFRPTSSNTIAIDRCTPRCITRRPKKATRQ